jgi:hypothetical protein
LDAIGKVAKKGAGPSAWAPDHALWAQRPHDALPQMLAMRSGDVLDRDVWE